MPYFLSIRTYVTSAAISFSESFLPNAGILPLPFRIELKMCSSVMLACHFGLVRLRAWLSFPLNVFARPSFPWQLAQFLRKRASGSASLRRLLPCGIFVDEAAWSEATIRARPDTMTATILFTSSPQGLCSTSVLACSIGSQPRLSIALSLQCDYVRRRA